MTEQSFQKALDTPVMEQYRICKEQYPDAILLFRLGDFYEMFFDDAVTASEILGLTLTSRHKEAGIPMAGVPYHSVDGYIRKLLDAGKKVALCEQMEKADKKKKMIAREVVRIFTPGTVVEEEALDEARPNYLLAATVQKETAALVWCDVSCGDVFFALVETARLSDTVRSLAPAEIIAPTEIPAIAATVAATPQESAPLSTQAALYLGRSCRLTEQNAALGDALRLLIGYLDRLYFGKFPPLRDPQPGRDARYMLLDSNTVANLELDQTLIGGERVGSLLWAIDRTMTVMGRRLLRNVVLSPLRDRDEIVRRLDTVEQIFEHSALRRQMREILRSVKDIERTLARLLVKRGGPREVVALCSSLEAVLSLRALLRESKEQLTALAPLMDSFDLSLDDIRRWRETFREEQPLNWREGGFVRPEHSTETARLDRLVHDSKGLLLELEERERKTSGIPSLKLGYTRVFGYYLEVSKRFADKVPSHYIRKQTTVNGERYFTTELKELEETILTARERLVEEELRVLEETITVIAAREAEIQAAARFAAWCDLFASFAELAATNGWERPGITDEAGIAITEGRHPVVEQILGPGRYVPASLVIGDAASRLNIITGPNMGGKSTLMRAVALITLLAQCGSFVPAKNARIGIVDAIFTRVGASDNLARGQSTFLVEMQETAFILRNATARSLVILDEIGRGTGTYDGISLARAIAEYLVRRIGAVVLFATHYHILTELADELPGVKNYHMTAREYHGGIQFLYQLAEGGSSRSFGVEVARLAGLPSEVVRTAEKTLRELERADRQIRLERGGSMQMDIFSLGAPAPAEATTTPWAEAVRDLLFSKDPDHLTPKEALELFYTLRATIHSEVTSCPSK